MNELIQSTLGFWVQVESTIDNLTTVRGLVEKNWPFALQWPL